MKKTSQLIIVYITLITIVSTIYNFINSQDKEQLKIVVKQLDGLEYITNISALTMHVTKYVGAVSSDTSSKELRVIYKDINNCVNAIYAQQKLSKEFINPELNKQLQKIKKFEVSEDGYYQFLDTINHENYRIGNISKLMFFQENELFFLSSLITHHMPEYMISLIITHHIVQESSYLKTITDKKKNIFIEQTKLANLSEEEMHSIIDLLDNSNINEKLKQYILSMHDMLHSMKPFVKTIYKWDSSSKREEYLQASKELIVLSREFEMEQITVIKTLLNLKKAELNTKIFINNIIFILLTLIFSTFIYLYYKSIKSHEKKDREIERINKNLDDLVVYSKTDVDGYITYVSGALAKISGYSKEELLGKKHSILRHEGMSDGFFKDLWETILDKKVFTGEVLNRAKDGSEYWVRITISPELDKQGKIIEFSSHRINITDQKALEEKRNELLVAYKKLELLSVIDPLTQIFNRVKLDKVMSRDYDSYKRFKKVFSLILIDIDYFKIVNDEYGHLVGDKTLKSVVNIVNTQVRETDTFGRWGGEEFMLICEGTDAKGAFVLAQKIRTAVEEYEFETIGKKTVSIGISEICEKVSINDFIKRADDALYYAKEHGRNRCVIYSDPM